MKRRRECREHGCKRNGSPDGGRCKVHAREYAARLGASLIARATPAPSVERDGREFTVTVLPADAGHRRRRRR